MNKRQFKNATLAFLLAIPLIFSVPFVGTASAQNPACDSTVVDDAGIFGTKLADVEKAASDLQSVGADPRYRTIKTIGSAGNMDNYLTQMKKTCPGWTRARVDGDLKNNLVVIMIAMNEKLTLVAVGGDYSKIIDNTGTARIRTGFTDPQFKNGNFALGFVNGSNEIKRLVGLQLNPPTATPQAQQPAVVVVQPSQPAAPPPDLSGLWNVLLWAFILIAVAVSTWFVYTVALGYFDAQAKKRAAQQKAKLAVQAASARIADWDEEYTRAKLQVDMAVKQTVSQDAKRMNDKMLSAQKLSNKATANFADLSHSATDPEKPNLTVEEYTDIAQAYEGIVGLLQQAENEMNEALQQAKELLVAVSDSPKVMAAADEAIQLAEKRIKAIEQLGFVINQAEALLAQAQAAQSRAKTLHEEKRYLLCITQSRKAIEGAADAAKLAEGYPIQQKELVGLASDLDTRIEKVQQLIIAGRQVFEQVSAMYAQSSWISIKGNGVEAENRINWSLKAAQVAKTTAEGFDPDAWVKGKAAVTDGGKWLDEAESLMRSIHARKQGLDEAKRDASREIRLAQDDIVKALEYIKKYDDDIRDSLEADLKAADAQLKKAQAELAKEKPDYIVVVKLAKNANESADNILASARQEHEAAERLRQQVAGALRDAKRAVSKAKEYIEDHSSDVNRTAKNKLSDSQEALEAAMQTNNLQRQVAYANDAQRKADAAYEKAASDVDEAEEERRPRYSSVSIDLTPSSGSSGGWSSSNDSSSSSSGGWGSSSSDSSSSSSSSGGWG